MPKKLISKIASRVESVRTTLVEETLPETLSKVKSAGNTVAEGANKAGKNATKTLSSVKDNATTVVASGIKQVSEIEWKKELEKVKSFELPAVSKLRPIDWTAEHTKFWEQDKAEKALESATFDSDEKSSELKIDDAVYSNEPPTLVEGAGGSGKIVKEEKSDSWDGPDAPHALITGAAVNKTAKKKQYELVNGISLEDAQEIDFNSDDLIPVEVPKKIVDEDELVYTTISEGFGKTSPIIIAGKPGNGKGYSTRQDLLNEVSGVLNAELEKEENKLSVDDSKEKDSVPAPKKTAKAVSKEPVVTVLGTGAGEVEPLGVAYKKLIRKVAKQTEKNPDVKLYLSGKTFGIGARGTVEQIDGNDVNVFNAKDIKKLLAKIS